MSKIRVLLAGIHGTMGKTFLDTETNDIEVLAGFGTKKMDIKGIPCVNDLDELTIALDMIIDFSHFSALEGLLDYASKKNLPILVASTGHTEENMLLMEKASKIIPVFFTQNSSLGIYALGSVIGKVLKQLKGFEVEIKETHHNKKKDSPSGTAEYLFNQLKKENHALYPRHGRSGNDLSRPFEEVGIHSLRGGTVVGEHEVVFYGEDEVVTISHQAFSKKIFTKGAIEIAKFLINKKAGFYQMEDLDND